MIGLPTIIVNFKTYKESTGICAERLARAFSTINNFSIGVAVQAADIHRAASYGIPVFAQHADNILYGAHTGRILPESLRDAGATGVILNHSEHRISAAQIKKTIARCHDAGLIVLLCTKDVKEAQQLSRYSPDMIAIEPPELIGGKVSVSTARPELIRNAVRLLRRNILLVGAGIHTSKDAEIAARLGASGLLVSSGIIKAKNPLKALKELVKGWERGC